MAFKKQTKTIKDQGDEQVDALKSLQFSKKQLLSIIRFISKERLNSEIADELKRTEEEEQKADRSKIVYKRRNKQYNFRKFKAIRAFADGIKTNFIDIYMATNEQNHLANYIKDFKNQTRPSYNSNLRKVKEDILNSAMALLKRREMMFKAFESGIFSKLKDNPKQAEESKQFSNYNKNVLLESDNN